MAKRFHLFPFRTQQLSSFAPTILGLLDLGKLVNAGFFLFIKKGVSNETPFFVLSASNFPTTAQILLPYTKPPIHLVSGVFHFGES